VNFHRSLPAKDTDLARIYSVVPFAAAEFASLKTKAVL